MSKESTSTERALKLALEALEGLEALLLSMGLTHLIVYGDAEKAITALQEALAEQPAQQEPVGCEGAIVNGRVYADRLEHDYKFECEAGPLHLCADWVELRRCFEWLAQHTSPPAQRKPLTDEEIEKVWGIHRDDDEHFDITYERDITRAIEAELQRKNDE